MIKSNLDLEFMGQEIELLDAQEMAVTDGGSFPWAEVIKNIGEVASTLGGFIDGLLGK